MIAKAWFVHATQPHDPANSLYKLDTVKNSSQYCGAHYEPSCGGALVKENNTYQGDR